MGISAQREDWNGKTTNHSDHSAFMGLCRRVLRGCKSLLGHLCVCVFLKVLSSVTSQYFLYANET